MEIKEIFAEFPYKVGLGAEFIGF